MNTCVLACFRYTDDGGGCDARTPTRNQPRVIGGQGLKVLNNILCKGHQRPATAVPVQPDLNLTGQAEQVILDSLGCLNFVEHEFGMQVQRPAPEIGPFKGIGFGDTAGRTLTGLKRSPRLPCRPSRDVTGGDDTRLVN